MMRYEVHDKITGARCHRCGSEGPFLLDAEQEFEVDEAGDIHFPEGEWGIDMECMCPACWFRGRLADYYVWVDEQGRPWGVADDGPEPASKDESFFWTQVRESRPAPTDDPRRTATENGIYNGYANYETWATVLWLENDEGSARYWREAAGEAKSEAPGCRLVKEGIWSVERAPCYLLADRLREEVRDGVPELGPTLYSDLLNAALAEVNWHEVADAFLEE